MKVTGELDKRGLLVPNRGVNWSRGSRLASVDKPAEGGGRLRPGEPTEPGPAGRDLRWVLCSSQSVSAVVSWPDAGHAVGARFGIQGLSGGPHSSRATRPRCPLAQRLADSRSSDLPGLVSTDCWSFDSASLGWAKGLNFQQVPGARSARAPPGNRGPGSPLHRGISARGRQGSSVAGQSRAARAPIGPRWGCAPPDR